MNPVEQPSAPPPWRGRALIGAGLLGALLASVYGQFVLWNWYVEDAAISFAYARNLADGVGLVRFAGDERVEGYSNPLWVFLMATWEVFGFTGFQSSKAMALGLCAISLTAVWAFFRRVGRNGWGVLAAWILALDAQFVIWSASGLENSLFCALLALGMWRTVAEEKSGGFPYAAVCFLGLALTRPEGILYAALGGFWALVLEASGPRRWRRILAWLAVFWIPLCLYHAVRFNYFAFEFPATYYAKLGDARFQPLNWNGRAWMYLRKYSHELGRLWFLPVFLFGVIGTRRWRGWAVMLLSVLAAGFLLYPGVEPLVGWGVWPEGLRAPQRFVTARIAFLALLAGLVPLLGIGNEGWRGKILAWLVLMAAILFSLRSTGDWMRGFRWMSLASVPLAMLFGFGAAELFDGGRRVLARFGTPSRPAVGAVGLAVALVSGVAVSPQIDYQRHYRPETTPNSVKRRVDHYRWAMRQMHIEYADILDHDMGAMVYWAPDLGVVRDAKGLIDLPFALHGRGRAFVEQYAWEEYPFDLAHAHASTGQAVRRQGLRWTQEYIEIPGYGRSGLHTANFVRKSLFMKPWEGSGERRVEFEEGVVLHGLEFPAPEIDPGAWGYLEFGLEVEPRSDPIRLLLVLRHLETGEVSAYDLPLGYDDWYPVTEWKKDEVFSARGNFRLHPDSPLGVYEAGVVLVGEDGPVPARVPSEEPWFMEGEVHWSGRAIEVVPRKRMKRLALDDIDRGLEAAEETRCNSAVKWWRKARAHRSRSWEWQRLVRLDIDRAIASCFANRALTLDREGARAEIRRARRWDALAPDVVAAGQRLGDQWYAKGIKAEEKGNQEVAYGWFRDALHANPGLSWARRRAEALRTVALEAKRELPSRFRGRPRPQAPVREPEEE